MKQIITFAVSFQSFVAVSFFAVAEKSSVAPLEIFDAQFAPIPISK